MYEWSGKKASGGEKLEGNKIASNIKNQRKGCELIFLDSEGSDDFWKLLGGKKEIKMVEKTVEEKKIHEVYELSESNGKLAFKKVAEGQLRYSMLKSEDVYVADLDDSIIVWVHLFFLIERLERRLLLMKNAMQSFTQTSTLFHITYFKF